MFINVKRKKCVLHQGYFENQRAPKLHIRKLLQVRDDVLSSLSLPCSQRLSQNILA